MYLPRIPFLRDGLESAEFSGGNVLGKLVVAMIGQFILNIRSGINEHKTPCRI